MRRGGVFAYLFVLYLLTAASETFISPLFPLIRQDLSLAVSDQAALTAVLTLSIGAANLTGGWVGVRHSDRAAVRLSAITLALGTAISGMATNLGLLYLGQALTGIGVGLFFGPGLSIVGRMYIKTRGRAIAIYGLAYSLGLAIAAFSTHAGAEWWRSVFFTTAALAAVLAVFTPEVEEGEGARSITWARDAISYVGHPLYRVALLSGVAAGTTHYVVIGLTPQLFVDRGAELGVVAGLVGVGRLASVGGKIASGWMFDRIGGVRVAQVIMASAALLGAGELLLPGQSGLWLVAPFVCVTAMLFPVSNALVVTGLPARASWGVGIYRSTLMTSSAASAGLVSLALRAFDTTSVMLVALGLPLVIAAVIERWRGADALVPAAASAPAETTSTTTPKEST